MIQIKKLTAALGTVFLLGACANMDFDAVSGMEAQGTAFHKELHKEYVRLAKLEADEFDWWDAAFFNSRARRAAAGENFGPQEFSERNIPAHAMPLMEASRERLMEALAGGAADSKPIPAARAQAAFDCWMQEQEEDIQPEHIEACRAAFMDALRQLRAVEARAPAPPAPPPPPAPAAPPPPEIARNYIVFFDWDSEALTDAAKAIVASAVENSKKAPVSRFNTTGHADRSGADNYNLMLSRRRAQAVADHLLELGVEAGTLKVDFEGERSPLVQTDDGVREPQNRRVEINLAR
jgi:OOP family OmpA-OmpF porin